jgi:sugar/nucleoside kinase (ribokinase family)
LSVRAFTIGGVIVDCVVEADGTLHVDQPGGNALHAAAGARLFLDRVGVVGRVPETYPRGVLADAARSGLDVEGIRFEPGTEAVPEWFLHRADGSRVDHLHAAAEELTAFGIDGPRLSREETARWQAHLERRTADRPGFAAFRARHPVRPEDVPAAYWRAAGVHIGANAPDRMVACAQAARRAGLRVTLDPGFQAANLDPGGLRALLESVDAFLPSEKELALLRPGLDVRAALADIAEGTCAVIGVKRGADGAILRLPDGATREIRALNVVARDPVGAGDAFCGGFLSALVDGADWDEALARGTVAGAFAVEGTGITHLLAAQPALRDARLRAAQPRRNAT